MRFIICLALLIGLSSCDNFIQPEPYKHPYGQKVYTVVVATDTLRNGQALLAATAIGTLTVSDLGIITFIDSNLTTSNSKQPLNEDGSFNALQLYSDSGELANIYLTGKISSQTIFHSNSPAGGTGPNGTWEIVTQLRAIKL